MSVSRKKKAVIDDIGLYVSAALGLLEPEDGAIQPILIEPDIWEGYWAAEGRKYRSTEHGKEVRRRGVREYRIRRGRAEEHGDFSIEQWEEIKKEFGYRCAYCRRVAFLEMEHVIPIVKGGRHTKSNIVPACRNCNSRKQGRTPEEAGMTIKRGTE